MSREPERVFFKSRSFLRLSQSHMLSKVLRKDLYGDICARATPDFYFQVLNATLIAQFFSVILILNIFNINSPF